jgi:hypothetical protein
MVRINPKVGKWEIVVEDDGMLPDDYIMLKNNDYPYNEIYMMPLDLHHDVLFSEEIEEGDFTRTSITCGAWELALFTTEDFARIKIYDRYMHDIISRPIPLELARNLRLMLIQSFAKEEKSPMPSEQIEKPLLPDMLKGVNASLCNALPEADCKKVSKKRNMPCRWVPASGNRKAYCGIASKKGTQGEFYRKKQSGGRYRSRKQRRN